MSVIGIDLGTTYSCVGVYKNGTVEIVANDQGNRTTPSVVSFGSERLVGDAAKVQAGQNPLQTIFDAKRLIGRTYSDPTVKEDMAHWPFKVVAENDRPLIQVEYQGETRTFTPEEISAMILAKMKEVAESYLGSVVKGAVITVPAYFNDAQRQSTRDAGKIAGLDVLRIINEPTAAAMAYGKTSAKKDQVFLIFDLGGGTFDVSLVSLEGEVYQVLATLGDTHLGGEDFDNRLVDHCMSEFARKHKPITSDRARARIRMACERAKRTLSSATSAFVEVDSVCEGLDLSVEITRAKFESLCDDLFQKTLDPVRRVLEDAKVDKSRVDEVVLVGGSTRIPRIQKLLSAYFAGKTLNKTINPDEAVAYGATILAGTLVSDEPTSNLILLDVVPISLGVQVAGGAMNVVVPRGSTLPCIHKSTYTTHVDNQPAVDIKVYEGERKFTRDNHYLGKFSMQIPLMARGVPQIEVTFAVDANGILSVSAVETSTGKEQAITIKGENGRLSVDEIERMLREAEEFREADEIAKREMDARNALESFAYTLRETDPERASELEDWIRDHPKETAEVYESKMMDE